MTQEQANVPREHIEWCDIWVPFANVERRPRVLLIGDSISRQYYPAVAQALEGVAAVARLATSRCVGDPVLRDELALVMRQYAFDVVHFNNGLHGWEVSEDEYDTRFAGFLQDIRALAPAARLIWATTTTVREKEDLTQFDEKTLRVQARNAIVQKHLAALPIAINDLYTLSAAHADYTCQDGVHLTPEGITALADQVAHTISETLAAVPV